MANKVGCVYDIIKYYKGSGNKTKTYWYRINNGSKDVLWGEVLKDSKDLSNDWKNVNSSISISGNPDFSIF